MWSVATECLSIILSVLLVITKSCYMDTYLWLQLLETYKYSEYDATDRYADINGRSNLLPRPPGFLLIREISYGSELFKKIVYVIEQGVRIGGQPFCQC